MTTIPEGVRVVVLDVMETLIPLSRKKMAGEVAKHSKVPGYVEMIDIIRTTSDDESVGFARLRQKLRLLLQLLCYLLLHLPQSGVLLRTYRSGVIYQRFMRGEVSEDAFFHELQSQLKLTISQERFFEVLRSTLPPPDKRLLELILKSWSRGLKVALLTNIDPVLLKHFQHSYAWWQQIDAVIASCDFGALKPSHSLFQKVEEATGFAGAEVFFIDNSSENIDAAKKAFGWQVHLWEEK